MFMVCCVATGTLLLGLPDHIMCGMSHPETLASLSRQAINTLETLGSGEAAGPENVRHASISAEPGLSVDVMLLYSK